MDTAEPAERRPPAGTTPAPDRAPEPSGTEPAGTGRDPAGTGGPPDPEPPGDPAGYEPL